MFCNKKEMSFLKINDPLKRDAIVKEYLELKKKIRSNFLSERIGEQQLQTDLSKFYKPITETQKATTREITEGFKPVKEGLETIRREIQDIPDIVSGVEAIKKYEKELEEEEEEKEKKKKEEEAYFSQEVLNQLDDRFKGKIDKIFGIKREKDDKFHLGSKVIGVDDNNIITIENIERKFTGTPGMWELIVNESPKDYTEKDYNDYKYLMTITNAMYRNDDPRQDHPKPANNDKWRYTVGPIWYMNKGFDEDDAFRMAKDPEYKKKVVNRESRKRHREKRIGRLSRSVGSLSSSIIEEGHEEGSGVVVIPSDPNALLERLDLLLASQEAGHTGVRNELVSICDELKRQGVLDTNSYKKLNHLIKK